MFLKLDPNHSSRDVPLAVIVPNLVTTLALCSGLVSLHFILADQWEHAMIAIIAAGVFDVLDGGAARLLRVTTKFGAMLDSLSDFLAFGVAPAMLLHQWILAEKSTRLVDTLGLIAVMVFAVCAALRLARFTSSAIAPGPPASGQSPATSSSSVASTQRPKASAYFVGMPTPAGAAAVMVPAFIQASDMFKQLVGEVVVAEWIVATYTIVIGLLMVSRIPTFALKGLRIARRALAPVLVLLVVLVALMIRHTWLTMAGLSLAYLFTIPLAMVTHRRAKRPGGKVSEAKAT